MNTSMDVNYWQPLYPSGKKCGVHLKDAQFSVGIASGNTPYIMLPGDCSLENPACFWVDEGHVYLRLNWEEWSTISTDNPMLLTSIGNMYFCQIVYFKNGAIWQQIPVYRVSELPVELFDNANYLKCTGRTLCQTDITATTRNWYQECVNQILQIVGKISGELNVTDGTNVGAKAEEVVVISGNNHALILQIVADREECVEKHYFDPETRCSISYNKSDAVKIALARLQPDWNIKAGIFTSPEVASGILICLMGNYDLSAMAENVFSSENLASQLNEFFFPGKTE